LTGGLPVALGAAEAGTPGLPGALVTDAGGLAGGAGFTLTSSTSKSSIEPGGIGGRDLRS